MRAFGYKALVTIIVFIPQIVYVAQSEKHDTVDVRGKVCDTLGRPIKHATIRVYREKQLVTEIAADEQGNFQFIGLSTGAYIFKVARKSGYGNSKSLDREITLRPGQTSTVDLIALNIPDHWPSLKGSISGVVMRSDKEPIEGARVKLINPFYQQVISEIITGKDGRYQFPIDMQGQYIIQAFYPGFTVVSKNVLALGGQHSIDITLSIIP